MVSDYDVDVVSGVDGNGKGVLVRMELTLFMLLQINRLERELKYQGTAHFSFHSVWWSKSGAKQIDSLEELTLEEETFE